MVADALKNRTFADTVKKLEKSAEKNALKKGIASSSIAGEMKKDGGNDMAKRGISLSSIADELKKYESRTAAEIEERIRSAAVKMGLAGSSVADGLDAAKGETPRYSTEKIKRRLTEKKAAVVGGAISPEAVEKTADAGRNPNDRTVDGRAVSLGAVEKTADAGKNPNDKTVDGRAISLRAVEKTADAGKNPNDRIVNRRAASDETDGRNSVKIKANGTDERSADGENLDGEYVGTGESKRIKRKENSEEKYRMAYEFYSEMDKNTARRLIEGDAYLENYLGKEYYERLRNAFRES
jgi:hypothetical protein